MASKLEREANALCEKMTEFAREIDGFSMRKLGTLPSGTAWTLLRASLTLISAASKVQLAAAKQTMKDTKKHFGVIP